MHTEHSATSPMVPEDEGSGHVDAGCACGCELVQPVGQIIVPANHSCFQSTRPAVWHISADPGRVVELTYRLLTGAHGHDETADHSRSVGDERLKTVVFCPYGKCCLKTTFRINRRRKTSD